MAHKPLAPIRRQPSLVDYCVAQLRGRIAAKAAGTQLATEADLMAELGVSRTTVRDAVARLKAEGLITSLQGKGLLVADPAHRQFVTLSPTRDSAREALTQVFELRHSIEVGAARLAALRRTEADLAALRSSFEAMAEPLSSASSAEHGASADIAFHAAIANATGNPLYTQLFEFVQQQMLQARLLAWKNSDQIGLGPAPAMAEHEVLLDAIIRQDPQAAAEAADSHLRHSAARFGIALTH